MTTLPLSGSTTSRVLQQSVSSATAPRQNDFGQGLLSVPRAGFGRGWRRFAARDFADDLVGNAAADGASGVVDAALGEGQLAAAGAALGVQAMQRDFFLRGGQSRKTHSGQF